MSVHTSDQFNTDEDSYLVTTVQMILMVQATCNSITIIRPHIQCCISIPWNRLGNSNDEGKNDYFSPVPFTGPTSFIYLVAYDGVKFLTLPLGLTTLSTASGIPCRSIATIWASLLRYAAVRIYSVSQRFYCCVLGAYRHFLMALLEETTNLNSVLPWTRDSCIAKADGFIVTTNKRNNIPVRGKFRIFSSEGNVEGPAKHQQHFLVWGSVHYKFVATGQTVNQHYYQEVLRQ
jgi:hypothetical protein